MSRRWALGAALVLSLGALDSRAQESEAKPEATSPPPSRTEVQRRLRLLRAWEITRALKLDGDAAGKVLAVFARTDARRQGLFRQLHQSRRELTKLTRKRNPDAAAIQTQVDLLVKSRLELAQLWNEEFQELRGILTPLQQAKFLLAQRRFETKIQKLLRQVRKK